jgi:hypothetical protein
VQKNIRSNPPKEHTLRSDDRRAPNSITVLQINRLTCQSQQDISKLPVNINLFRVI